MILVSSPSTSEANCTPFAPTIKLLAADEVAQVLARETHRILVMAAGQRPVILKRAIYYQDDPFKGRYDSPEIASKQQTASEGATGTQFEMGMTQ